MVSVSLREYDLAMSDTGPGRSADRSALAQWVSESPGRERAEEFVPGPGVKRLPNLRFDVDRLRTAVVEATEILGFDETFGDNGFGVLPLTRRPGTHGRGQGDLSGRYWIRPDDTYREVARDVLVDEFAYTEFLPELAGTYFCVVFEELTKLAPIGRMRVNRKAVFNCNSWHRDPEPRLHVPIHTNPGALFIVNHHATHLPADGSVYFTDTRGYHTALNGGEHERVHLVAALPQAPLREIPAQGAD